MTNTEATRIDLEVLERVALAATPGPWAWDFLGVVSVSGTRVTDSLHCTTGERNSEMRNGQYIAAANPQVVVALVAAVKAARAFVDDCPLDRTDTPYVADICNGKEFQTFVAALQPFKVTKC